MPHRLLEEHLLTTVIFGKRELAGKESRHSSMKSINAPAVYAREVSRNPFGSELTTPKQQSHAIMRLLKYWYRFI
jgi:hypothetical protein